MNISPVQATSAGASPVYLDFNLFCDLTDRADDEILRLEGPLDPLLHLHFFHMVRHAAERGKRVTTTSLLTAFPKYCAAECTASGLYAMHVALDAADARLYHELYGKDCFDKVIRNVRRLITARANADSGLPRVYLACTATRRNLAILPDLVQLAREERFDAMLVKTPDDCTALSRAPTVSFQTMRTIISEERLEFEDPERIAFYFDRALTRARTLALDLRLQPVGGKDQQSSYV